MTAPRIVARGFVVALFKALVKASVVALAVVAIAGGFLALSWSSVNSLLADDAQLREQGWSGGMTPWRWDLRDRDAIVWPGSVGFERTDLADPMLVGVIADGNADLSLALRGGAIDLTLVDGLQVQIRAGAPVRMTLLAQADGEAMPVGAIQADRFDGFVTLPVDAPRTPVARALRLHLEAPPGSRVALGGVVATARSASLADCQAAPSCRDSVPKLTAPSSMFPETLLAWRDGQLATRPAAIISPPFQMPRSRAFAAEVRAALDTSAAWLLIGAPLLVGLLSRTRRTGATSTTRAGLELALVFMPWLLVQWADAPGDAEDRATHVFLACLTGALLLRPPVGEWKFHGDTRAWKAAGWFALAMLPVLGIAFAAADRGAVDGARGLVDRHISAEKVVRYSLWALLQQWLLLRAIAPHMRAIMGRDSRAALAAGALFGLLHVPNFALMIATGFAGSIWAWLGFRHRALLPLAISHAALGLALLQVAPPWLVRSAEVGARYLMSGGM